MGGGCPSPAPAPSPSPASEDLHKLLLIGHGAAVICKWPGAELDFLRPEPRERERRRDLVVDLRQNDKVLQMDTQRIVCSSSVQYRAGTPAHHPQSSLRPSPPECPPVPLRAVLQRGWRRPRSTSAVRCHVCQRRVWGPTHEQALLVHTGHLMTGWPSLTSWRAAWSQGNV